MRSLAGLWSNMIAEWNSPSLVSRVWLMCSANYLFRTIILIAIVSTLYTLFSIAIAGTTDSVIRIASNIVTGIGFLGAGTILRDGGRIGALTTAATIWLVATLGMRVGADQMEDVFIATGIAVIVLLIFPRLIGWMDKYREARTYKIVIGSGKPNKIEKLHQAFKDCHLSVTDDHMHIADDSIIASWRTLNTSKNQDKFVQLMIKDKNITSSEY